MNRQVINGNTLTYDILSVTELKSRRESSELSKVNQKCRSVKRTVNQSSAPVENFKRVLNRVIDGAHEIDYSNKSARELMSSIILEELITTTQIGWEGVSMYDSLEKILVGIFCTKPDVLQIEKVVESTDKDYWIIVEDSLSDSALEYNGIYFDIMRETDQYFEFKVLDVEDLEVLVHIERHTLFKRGESCG